MGKRHLPPLQAGRVRLRLLEEQDLPRTLAWRNQDHIRRWFFFSERLTLEQHAGWFARYQQRDDDFVFIIEEQCHAGTLRVPSVLRRQPQIMQPGPSDKWPSTTSIGSTGRPNSAA